METPKPKRNMAQRSAPAPMRAQHSAQLSAPAPMRAQHSAQPPSPVSAADFYFSCDMARAMYRFVVGDNDNDSLPLQTEVDADRVR